MNIQDWFHLGLIGLISLQSKELSRLSSPAAAAKSLQSCLTLCNPRDGSPPGSTVPGILQARTLEWVAIPFFRGSSWPRDWTHVSCVICIGRRTTKSNQLILKEINPEYSLEGLILKLKIQYFGYLIEELTHWKDSEAGKDWGQEDKGTTEDETVGWHHWLSGHKFEQTLGDSEG